MIRNFLMLQHWGSPQSTNIDRVQGTPVNKEHYRIMKLKAAIKAMESNPMLMAGKEIKGYLPGGCLNFS